MSNVRKLNQDDVLPDDGLSPSAFDRGAGEIEDEQPVKPKKKSTLMPLVGGVVVALAIVGFFGWKIASPYLADRGGSGGDAFNPTATPKPFEPTPNTAPDGALTADAAVNLPALPVMPGNASPQTPLTAGQSLGLVQPTQPAGAANGLSANQTPIPVTKLVAEQAQAPAPTKVVSPTGPTADEIAQINKRIDGLGAALESLKGAVAKLQQQPQAKPAPTKLVVVNKQKPPVAQKPAPVVVLTDAKRKDAVKNEKPVAAKQQERNISTAAAGMQLQAVLQDRAWFKTSTGETVTVSPGEELPGVGIVQQIDAESGRVVFTNGLVYR